MGKSANAAAETAPESRPPGGGKYGGKLASTRQRERRRKLRLAAIKLFGRDGFSATSIDALCAEAGLTKRYFYESFSSRDELLVEAFQAVTKDFLNALLQAAAPVRNDSRALVRAGLEQVFVFVADNPEKARLMMIEAMMVRSQLGVDFHKSFGAFVELLVGFTKPFLAPGVATDTELKVMARGICGALIHLCQGWIASGFKQPRTELVQGAERILSGLGRELGIAGWADDPLPGHSGRSEGAAQ